MHQRRKSVDILHRINAEIGRDFLPFFNNNFPLLTSAFSLVAVVLRADVQQPVLDIRMQEQW